VSMVNQRPLRWRKSTACASDECVEVAYWEDRVLVRSSREPKIVVRFSGPQWKVFLASVAGSVVHDSSRRVASDADDTDATGVSLC
jgi:hypothetical protein